MSRPTTPRWLDTEERRAWLAYVEFSTTIAVEWRTEGDTLHITVDVPPTTTATVVLPDGEELTAGPGRSQYLTVTK
jgi:hypothetical protein